MHHHIAGIMEFYANFIFSVVCTFWAWHEIETRWLKKK